MMAPGFRKFAKPKISGERPGARNPLLRSEDLRRIQIYPAEDVRKTGIGMKGSEGNPLANSFERRRVLLDRPVQPMEGFVVFSEGNVDRCDPIRSNVVGFGTFDQFV